MFRKILIATDLSRASEEVVCSLGGLRALGTREALLLRCLDVRDVGALSERLEEMLAAKWESQRKRVAALGFETEAEVVTGLPQIEIERQAESHDCSLIVIGSRGLSGLREFLLGSVANAMLHYARRPVLLLRVSGEEKITGQPCEPRDCDFLRHLLFPTDFSDNAEIAYRHVEETARRGVREITLLHVAPACSGRDHHDSANARLERIRDELLALGAGNVTIELVEGNPKREVLARTGDQKYSLVILGSQGQGCCITGGAMLGSVSHAVAYQGTVPLLFVPMHQ